MFERNVGERGPSKTRKIRIIAKKKDYPIQGVTIPNIIANDPAFSGVQLFLYTSGNKIILEPIKDVKFEKHKNWRSFDEIEKVEPW